MPVVQRNVNAEAQLDGLFKPQALVLTSMPKQEAIEFEDCKFYRAYKRALFIKTHRRDSLRGLIEVPTFDRRRRFLRGGLDS